MPSPLVDLRVQGPPNITLPRDQSVKVTFNIIVLNRSQSNLDKLLIKDHFDSGLEFLDSNNKALKSPIEYELGDLPAGKNSNFKLTFHVLQAGNLCHTVEVIRQGNIMARAQACVMVSAQSTPPPGIASPGNQLPSRAAPGATQGRRTRKQDPNFARRQAGPAAKHYAFTQRGPPTVTIKQTGPKTSQHTVGDTVSFVSQIANPNNRALTNLKIVYHFDQALLPKMATNYFRAEGGNLVWLIAQLPPGAYTQIEVQYQCKQAASKAGNTVSVSSSEGAQAQDTAYLDIRPAPGGAEGEPSAPGATAPGSAQPGGTSWSAPQKSGSLQGRDNQSTPPPSQTNQPQAPLSMTVTSLHPQVATGKELTFLILVVNNTGSVNRNVTLTALVPDGMIPVALGTKGPGLTQFDIDRQTVAFNPVMSVEPGETLTYQVRVRANRPASRSSARN